MGEREDYEKRFAENSVIEGYGEELCMTIPCPFCAAPDFMTVHPCYGIVPGDDRPDVDAQMAEEKTCEECGRSGKNLVERTESGVSAEFVQTGGADPPEWLFPMRRV